MSDQELARLTVVQGPTPGQEFPLSGAAVVIGREAACDIPIPASDVSRRHARLRAEGAAYWLEDLGSSNGTYVNGERLAAPRALRNGDEIRLGPSVVLRFGLPQRRSAADMTRVVPPPAEAVTPPTATQFVPPPAQVVKLPTATQFVPPPAEAVKPPTATQFVPPPTQAIKPEMATQFVAPPPAARLEQPTTPSAASGPPPKAVPPQLIITVSGSATTYDLTAPEVTVGRTADNSIPVASPFVSRQHLRLVSTPAGYELHVQPAAKNPVLLAGQPVAAPTLLHDGDEFVIYSGTPGQNISLRYADRARAVPPATVKLSQPASGPATMIASRPSAAGAPAGMATMIGQKLPQAVDLDAQLVVTVAGRPPQVVVLKAQDARIGRAPDNDVVIDDEQVSRHQARLHWTGDGFELVPEPNITNPVVLDGKTISEPTRLHHGARLRIGITYPAKQVSIIFLSPDDSYDPQRRSIVFKDKTRLSLGRDAANDIVLASPIISRYHALVEKVGQRYRIKDLRSSNGTFVNGQAINGEVWLKTQDIIRIGPYRFVMGENDLAQYDESQGVRVEAIHLNKQVRKDLNLLQDISLVFHPREFVVVVGQSGGGKSTLVDAISGYRPASHGQVLVNNVDIYKHFESIRHNIGYVPQKDIIHMDLTVMEALDYAARLRMPADTTAAERHQRVMEVLEDLDLVHRKDLKISGLSGGQQKRASIGVELLTKPGLFFLDEPTSGLDPGTETALMQLMRRLADQGRTIVLITHATKNVMLADKVVFLARGGYLAWFGPPDEGLQYFDQFRSERDRRAGPMEFDQIYSLLDDPAKGSPADWGERYRQQPAYQAYVASAMQAGAPQAAGAPAAVAPAAAAPAARQARKQVSSLRQFLILSARNIRILTRDRSSLFLMLLTAPAIGLLDVVLAAGQGRNPFAFSNGDMNNVVVSLIVLINNGVMVGGLSQMRELVKERDIYKRERMVNLRLIPYIVSKVWVAVVLSIYSAVFLVLIRNLAFEMPGGWKEIVLMYVTMVILIVAGSMLGLFASALAPNANSAPLVLILFLVPQIVLSGALVPLPQTQTAIASSRWAFQSLMAINGSGSDVARDVCWALPASQYDKLTDADIQAKGCNCSGIFALRQSSCNFPGLGANYDVAIDTPDPVKPADLGPEPAAPALPAEPTAPANMQDQKAVGAYLQNLQDYLKQVKVIQAAFDTDMAAYRANAQTYQTAITDYQKELTRLQIARASAKGSAKVKIRIFYNNYGWTFVDKNSDNYLRTLLLTWGVQLSIVLILFVATIFFQRRWDVA